MARPTRNYVSSFKDDPEFFKVFMPCFGDKTMWIPPAFVQHFIRKVPKNVTLKDEIGGYWLVRVEKIEDRLYFTSGWERFVQANLLERGDFLLFKLVTNSSFEVKIFGSNGCKKSLPSNFGHQESGSEESNSTDEVSDDESGIRIVEKSPKRKRQQNSALGSSSKELQGKKLPKSTATDNRCFSITHTAAKASRYVVTIPLWATKGIRVEEELVLRSQNNQLWPIGVRTKEDGRLVICSGWVRFVDTYPLRPNDRCLLKLVVDRASTCREIKVKITRNDA